MSANIEQEIATMRPMTIKQLKERYVELYGEPPRSGHRVHLVRRILWRQQALAEGDLSERASQRAAELANDADLRLSAPRRRVIVRAGAGTARLPDRRDASSQFPARSWCAATAARRCR